jgi:hypothetical protein
MNMNGHDPESEDAVIDDDEEEPEGSGAEADATMNTRRDEIAELMWRDYVAYRG